MAAIFCENCSFLYFQFRRVFQLSETGEGLVFIMLGKVLLNIFLLRVRKQNVQQGFMGYFCISLAFLDIVLLVTMSFFSYFQNFMLLGIQFTAYHACFLAQIAALTYGNLHFPVFFVTCLDYCVTISQTAKSSKMCCKSLYSTAVLFMWITVLCYVLRLPGTSIGLGISHDNAADQCSIYISSQSYWVSLWILFIVGLVLVVSWSDIMNMMQSIKLITFERETVFFFPYLLECNPKDCAKHLLARLFICFIGTWAPFIILQLLIVLLGAQIPAYIEMNVPWLYFVNSFLIAFAYWVRRPHIELTEDSGDVDPFVSWKFCFVPFICKDTDEDQKPTAEMTIC